MKNLSLLTITVLCSSLVACAGNENIMEESAPSGTTEQELNQPIEPTPDVEVPEEDDRVPDGGDQAYYFPEWDSSYGVTKSMYERVRNYYNQNNQYYENKRYVVIIDMGKKSNTKRFTLFDLKNQTFSRYLTSHGKNSDPNNDGWLDSFSNVSGSKQTSIGYYKTLGTYYGSNGRSLRLDGLESTNSNALSRAIVVHGASYVRESDSYAGRSWGCPALDHAVAQGVIDKIKNGSLFVIATSREI